MLMNRDALLRELAKLETLFANRIVITRIIIGPDGQELGRIVRGSFHRDSPSEPPKKEKPK